MKQLKCPAQGQREVAAPTTTRGKAPIQQKTGETPVATTTAGVSTTADGPPSTATGGTAATQAPTASIVPNPPAARSSCGQ